MVHQQWGFVEKEWFYRGDREEAALIHEAIVRTN